MKQDILLFLLLFVGSNVYQVKNSFELIFSCAGGSHQPVCVVDQLKWQQVVEVVLS